MTENKKVLECEFCGQHATVQRTVYGYTPKKQCVLIKEAPAWSTYMLYMCRKHLLMEHEAFGRFNAFQCLGRVHVLRCNLKETPKWNHGSPPKDDDKTFQHAWRSHFRCWSCELEKESTHWHRTGWFKLCNPCETEYDAAGGKHKMDLKEEVYDKEINFLGL